MAVPGTGEGTQDIAIIPIRMSPAEVTPTALSAPTSAGPSGATQQMETVSTEVKENGDAPPSFVPPDGGVRAWMVMFTSFLCNGIITGIINTSGITYNQIASQMEESGDPHSALKGCECGSVCCGCCFVGVDAGAGWMVIDSLLVLGMRQGGS